MATEPVEQHAMVRRWWAVPGVWLVAAASNALWLSLNAWDHNMAWTIISGVGVVSCLLTAYGFILEEREWRGQ